MEPLDIKVVVESGQLAKLGTEAKVLEGNIRSLAGELIKGNISAEQFGAAAENAARQVVEGSPKVQQLTNTFIELKAILATDQAELAKTAAIIQDAATKAGSEASIIKQLGVETGKVTIEKKMLGVVEGELNATIESGITTLQTSIEKHNQAATAAAALAQAEEAVIAVAATETAANDEVAASNTAVAATGKEATAAVAGQAEADVVAAAAGKENAAAQVENAAAAKVSMTAFASIAARVMAEGRSAAEATSMLRNLGATEKEAAAFVAEAEAATRKNTGALQQEAVSAQTATEALQQLGLAAVETADDTEILAVANENAAGKIDAFTRAEAYSAIRMATNEVGAGQLGFALARLGSISATLAPILAAVFPVFATIAAIQLLSQLDDKMKEWSLAAQKAADDAATFERALHKMSEAEDQAREKLAGTISPLAGLAEKMAFAGNKSVDLTSDMQALNKNIEAMPGAWSGVAKFIGDTWTGVSDVFRSQSAITAREIEAFGHQLTDVTKTAADVPAAIEHIRFEMMELDIVIQRYQNRPFLPGNEKEIASMKAMRQALEEQRDALQKLDEAQSLSGRADEISKQQQLAEAKLKVAQERLGFEADEAKRLTKLHLAGLEEEKTEVIRIEREQSEKQIAIVSSKEAALRRIEGEELASGKTVDHSAAFADMEAEKATIHEKFQRKRADIDFTYDEKIEARDEALANAQIQFDAKVAESAARVGAARAQLVFERADTPEAVEAAAIPLVEKVNELYRIQAEERKKAAAVIIKDLPAAQRPTAELGTDEFTDQLKVIEKTATEQRNKLLEISQTEISERRKTSEEVVRIAIDKEAKLRAIAAGELAVSEKNLENDLAHERGNYQQGAIALQTGLQLKRSNWTRYYEDVRQLAQKAYGEELVTLEKEVSDQRNAANAGTITQQQASIKIAEIYRQEENAYNQMKKRELEAAKAAIREEEREIRQMSQRIGQEFASAATRIITSNQSIGRSAVQLGAQLELYIIEQGIKRVVTHYAAALLQMVAEHSSFLAKILGIQVAGDASKLAAKKASSEVEVGIDAGEGAAAAFASVMEAVPFPFNVALAPEVAAETGAAIEAVGQFEHGGIVPGNEGRAVPIMAHAGEAVLPARLTGLLQNAASSNSSVDNSSSRGPVTIHNRPQITVHQHGGSMSPEEITRAVKKGLRNGHSIGYPNV